MPKSNAPAPWLCPAGARRCSPCGVGTVLGAPEGGFVAHDTDQGPPANGAVARRPDLDGHAVREVDDLARPSRDQGAEQEDLVQEGSDVREDEVRLGAIGRYDEEDGPLPRREIGAIIFDGDLDTEEAGVSDHVWSAEEIAKLAN